MYRRTHTCLSRYRNTVVAVGGDARVARGRLVSDATGGGTVDDRTAFLGEQNQKALLCRNQRVQPLRLAIKEISDSALSFPIRDRHGHIADKAPFRARHFGPESRRIDCIDEFGRQTNATQESGLDCMRRHDEGFCRATAGEFGYPRLHKVGPQLPEKHIAAFEINPGCLSSLVR